MSLSYSPPAIQFVYSDICYPKELNLCKKKKKKQKTSTNCELDDKKIIEILTAHVKH